MDNNNPAHMSNEDLEKDMEKRNEQNNTTGNQENVNKSTAAEGSLIDPSQDKGSKAAVHATDDPFKEKDLDELVHQPEMEDSQDGSLPDPEEIPEWEDDDRDLNKISS